MNKLFSLKLSIRLCLAVLLPGIIIGCASFEEKMQTKKCKTRDSHKDGYNDAMSGYKKSHFHVYNNKCEQYGVTLNQKLYIKGYKKGIKAFCTYEGGYQLALKRKKYQKNCSTKEKDFLKGYHKGDKECLYEAGYSHANEGKASSLPSVKCLKLSKTHSQQHYLKGWNEGLKVFCTYDKGYDFGLKGKKYLYTCPKKRAEVFLKGYRAGDKKCLYEAGYYSSTHGKQKAFPSVLCLKLSKTHSQKHYLKGWNEGLQVFCTYKTGYNLGLNNALYENICPKNLETNFFKGYTLGLQEYKADQRQKELLRIEQEKIAVERERIQTLKDIETQRIYQQEKARKEQIQALKDMETQRIHQQERARKDMLNSQKQKCKLDSDCLEGGSCRHNYSLKAYVCQYD